MESPPKLDGRVLILGEDTRSFLTVIRSLGRAGLEIHVAWCPPTSPALRSRYISKIHWLRSYQDDDPAWLAEFLQLLRRESFDLVIPCHDSAILPLQQSREQLQKIARIYLLEDAAFEVAFNKQKTYELAETLGICLPRQRIVRSEPELAAAAEDFGFPLVLKPQASVELQDVSVHHKVVKLRNASDWKQALEALDARGSILIQENFEGVGVGVEVLCHNGDILTAFQHERLHEPLFGGGSSYRKSVPLDPALLAATEGLMRALHYTGVAMVEFKMNPTTRKWILVEINGRFWGSLPLSVACGIDFPRYLYEMLCVGRTQFPTVYDIKRYARNWLLDLYWLRGNLGGDRADPILMTVPLPRVARESLNIALLRESSDTMTWDDPAPALAEASQFLRSYCLPRVRRLGTVRNYMQGRIRKAAVKARRILFVCKGNICRSPFAEAATRVLAHHRLEVRSAGYYPAPDRPCPEHALAAALEYGIDLSLHRSHLLDAAAAEWADIILLFDYENEEALRARFPKAVVRSHYLGALNTGHALEIADPFSKDLDAFHATYRQIFELLERHLLPCCPNAVQ